MMKRNSKQTKGWGFKFMAILSSIMMVINTVTPVVPVFAETETPSTDVVDVPAGDPTPAGDPAEDTVPADNDADKSATEATPAENPAEEPATVGTTKTDEDADKPADSQTITEQTDGNQDSGAKNNTSNGSDEKENNNTDQSLQNGENSETVDTSAEPVENEEINDGLNKEIITGTGGVDGVVVTVVAPEKSFPEGTYVVIKTIEEDPIVALDILQKEEQLESQVNANENVEIQKKVSFDISFFDPKNPGIEPEPVEGKQVSVVFDYKDNDEFANANKADIAVYHLEETTDSGVSVEAESKDTLSLNEVKKEIKEDLTDEYKDAISEADKNQSLGVVVDVTEFSVYTLAIKKNLSTTISEGTLLLDSNGGNFTAENINIIVDNSCTSNCQGSIESTNFSNHSGTIILPTVTREGYEFIGWFGGNKVGNAGQSIMIGSGKIVKNGGKLVAQFKKNTCDTNDDSLVACIGSIGYTSLPAAVSEVLTNNTATTIELLKDVSGPGVQIKSGQKIIFDLNDHTYTVANPTVGSAGTETNGFQMLKGSTVTFKDGGLESSTAKILLQNYCDLTLDNVKVNTQKNPQMQYASSNNFGSLNVKGKSEIHGSEGQVAFDIWYGMSSEYDNGVIVKFDENFSGIVDGTVQYGHDSRVTGESWREKAALIISGGNFDIVFEEESTYALSGANIKISGGKFEKPVDSDYLVEGLDWTTDSDGKYVLTDASDFEAQIGDAKYTTLAVAIAAVPTDGTQTTITLLSDVTSKLLVGGGRNIILNLNGKTLNNTSSYVYNGKLILKNGIFSDEPIWVYGSDSSSVDEYYSYLKIGNDVTMSSTSYDIVLTNLNGTNACYGATLDIYGTLSGNIRVMGNIYTGNSKINVYGTIKDGIHLNGNATVNVYDPANIESSKAALEVRAGTANIYGGNFKTNSTSFRFQPNGNGSSTEGVALAVAQHTTVLPITVNVYSGSFDGNENASLALLDPQSNNDAKNMHISIEGGNFKNGVVISNQTSCTDINNCLNGDNYYVKNFISGGTFSSPVAEEYCAAGYIPEDLGNGKYGVKEGEYVAQIGDKKYETLAVAVATVPTNGTETTIKLLYNGVGTGVIKGNGVVVSGGQNIVFDLQGNTYNVDGTVGSAGTQTNGFQLLKGSKVKFKNGSIKSDKACMLIQNYSDLVLEDVIMDGRELKNPGCFNATTHEAVNNYTVSNNFGSLTVKGNTQILPHANNGRAFDIWYGMSAAYDGGVSVIFDESFVGSVEGVVEYGHASRVTDSNWQEKATLNINGGNFDITFANGSADALSGANIKISGGTFTSEVPADYCADNYIPKNLGNGKYSVELGHKLTFKYDNGDDDAVEFIPNASTTVQPTSNPSKTGYTFTGWYTTGASVTKFSFGSTLSEDTELYAHWDVNKYNIQFVKEDGTEILSGYYDYGTGLTDIVPSAPDKIGYTFAGWNPAVIAVTGPQVYTATYTINQYGITFVDSGDIVAIVTGNYTSGITAPTISDKVGYTFSGWYDESDKWIDFSTYKIPVNGETLHAVWTPEEVEFTVKYFTERLDGEWTEQSSDRLVVLRKSGTIITGELKNYTGFITPEIQTGIVKGDGLGKIQYKYQRSGFNLEYVCENCGDLSSSASAVPASGTYLYETGMKVENAMTAPGYTFQWNMDGNTVEPGVPFTMPAHDVVITGKFLSGTANYTIEYYYQNADGSYPATANSGVIMTGTTDTLASVTDEDKTPTEVGYTLYNTGLNILSKAIDGDGDTILKVYFKKQFIVKYLSGNYGAFADEIHTGLDYGTGTPAAPTPIAQSGYSFSGWDIEPAVTVTADATYTAQWTANSYTVNFNSGGATSGTMNPQVFTYADGTTSYPLTAIGYEKEGYTFSGWTDGVNKYTDKADIVELLKAGSGTLNLTAEWTANSYTVTYKANSGVGTDFTGTATYDEIYAIRDNQGFTREGYEFSGWNTQANGNGTSYATGDSISPWKFTGDLTLYAQWTEVARTVNSQVELVEALAVPTIETITIGSGFDVESSVIIDRAVTIDGSGNTISMSGNQEWLSGGNNYIFKVYPASSADITIKDLTLTHALGAMIVGPNARVEVDKVDVSGNIWGGVEVIGTLSGKLIISDEKYEKPAAWIDASTITTQIVNLPGTTSGVIKNQVQYYYNPLHSTFFTITFDANSGSAVDAMTGIYDATITLPGSTRDGYTFSGRKAEDGTKYNSGASYTISGNATLTGVWDTVKYNITYHLDGGIEPTLANVTGYTIEESVTLTAPTKIGYTFLGWTGVNQSLFSGKAITIGTTGDKEFTANWQINEYRVNYHTGGHGALIESYTGVNYEASIPQTSLANVEGWTFSGWTLSGGGVIPATMPAHDIDLVAEWTIKSHNLTYSYVGTVPAGAPTGYTGTESVEYGSGITLKGTPAMSGYTFSGWTLSGATATSNSFTMPDNDIEILGEWIVQQFTITFDTDGGTDVTPITQDYNTSVTAPTQAPTKTGYQFSGWNPVVPATMPAENMIITGEWTANIYTVNFNSGGATSGTMNPQVFTYADATISYPLTANVFEKEGYTFSGWTDGANKYADGADVIELIKANSGTLDLTAEWKVNSHLLKYVVDGTEVYTGMLNYGDPITQYQDPTKDCNGFAGWTSNVEGITTGSTMPDSDVTFTANWNYTCTRSSGGGGGGGSSRNNTNNMQEVVLGGEVEVNTGDKAEINTGDENKLDESNDNNNGNGNTQGYDPELVEAYKWAYAKGITTMPTIEKARLKDGITRAELAKMMVVFMSEVLHRQPVITETFDYPDVNEKALGDLTGYIQLAYQYQIMGIQADGKPLNKFNPRGKVSRAEFSTVLSRVLYGSVNNQKGSNYREKHIEALNKAGILTNTDPKIQELRGWIILMLYRSQNSETNEEETTAQVTTGDVAEVESGSAAEVATGEVAQVATGDVAKVESGSVVEVATGTTAEIDTGAVVEANTGATAETAIAEANTGDVAKVESGSTAEVATGDSK